MWLNHWTPLPGEELARLAVLIRSPGYWWQAGFKPLLGTHYAALTYLLTSSCLCVSFDSSWCGVSIIVYVCGGQAKGVNKGILVQYGSRMGQLVQRPSKWTWLRLLKYYFWCTSSGTQSLFLTQCSVSTPGGLRGPNICLDWLQVCWMQCKHQTHWTTAPAPDPAWTKSKHPSQLLPDAAAQSTALRLDQLSLQLILFSCVFSAPCGWSSRGQVEMEMKWLPSLVMSVMWEIAEGRCQTAWSPHPDLTVAVWALWLECWS